MVINETRQQALDLTRNFCDAVSVGTRDGPDFYKMLWITHWAIEQFGRRKTRDAMEEIILAPNFEPEKAPDILRDTLLLQQTEHDDLEAWFRKAMAGK